jgi:hypothetical protein
MERFRRITDIVLSEDNDLRKLAEIAEANPKTFFRGCNMNGVDLRGTDLRGFDLTGVSAENCSVNFETKIDEKYFAVFQLNSVYVDFYYVDIGKDLFRMMSTESKAMKLSESDLLRAIVLFFLENEKHLLKKFFFDDAKFSWLSFYDRRARILDEKNVRFKVPAWANNKVRKMAAALKVEHMNMYYNIVYSTINNYGVSAVSSKSAQDEALLLSLRRHYLFI